MGTGSFYDNTFNFTVVARHTLTAPEKTWWQARFLAASRALYEATEGQLRFGEIYFADDGWGLGAAEFVVHPVRGESYATFGGYGRLGWSVQLFGSPADDDPLEATIVHEFGHHALSLGDEYTGPVAHDTIDTTTTFDEWSTGLFNRIPLTEATNDPAALSYALAMLNFGGMIERRIVASYDGVRYDTDLPPNPDDGPNIVRIYGSFNDNPHDAVGPTLYFQPAYTEAGVGIACGTGTDPYCLMGNYGDRGAVTEFCSPSTHESAGATAHHARHGRSCWEVIQQTMLERWDHAVATDPPTAGEPDEGFPFFFDLAKETRVALALDRSGSMSADNKIDGARAGVEQWINLAAEIGDFLSVSWFNDAVTTPLPLTEFTDPAAIAAGVQDATGLNPAGWTNIRDALFAAIEQIESRPHRAAIQAIVLLTDGLHNRPVGTSLLEAVPSLQAAGIPVYVVALGGPETIDLAPLEELARETGGVITNVVALGGSTDPNMQRAVISVEMIRVDALLRHGLVQVDTTTIGGLAPGDPIVRRVRRSASPALRTILGWYGAADLAALRRRTEPVATVRFYVERGAQRARFTMIYAPKETFRLVLVDPDGETVPFGGDGATLVDPDSPFTMAFVERPKAGEWTAIIARTAGAAASTVHTVATVENRSIVVRADCARDVPTGAPVEISAGAMWGDHLSNLNVEARLVDPLGTEHRVTLSDDRPGAPGSGDYRGYFDPPHPGRYTGTVSIVCRGDAVRAGALHRALHGPADKDASIDLRIDAPRFVRQVPIYVDVGGRPTPKDLDGDATHPRPPVRTRTTGLTPIRVRP